MNPAMYALAERAPEPSPGWGNFVGLAVALAVVYLAVTTHQRYRAPHDDSQDRPSPPPLGRRPDRRRKGVSERHASVDTYRDQPRRRAATRGDSHPFRDDTRVREGRLSPAERPVVPLGTRIRNVMRYGDPYAQGVTETNSAEAEESAYEPEPPPTPSASPTAPVQPYVAPTEEIDFALDDGDPAVESEPETLLEYVDRRNRADHRRAEIIADAIALYRVSDSTVARAIRKARAARGVSEEQE
ncbi:hypothetical protein [Winogradskya humida]|uniref:Uncharacterized protein n=1 Tax=Winogradskya humida TaxID=113566 RepID=A0ABQ4A786_9ACTN|nr:hypothetical protein [Actinoplanes humidus]GIE26726.1 hypothetical protein Ahu01nite_098280 [Actinoplanes humidus]